MDLGAALRERHRDAGAALTDPRRPAGLWMRHSDRLLATLPRSASNSAGSRGLPWITRREDRVPHEAGVRRELGAAAVSSRGDRPAVVYGLSMTLLGIGRLLELLEHTSPGADAPPPSGATSA
jgi:hypothetical protein